ncbi:HAD-IA family hydrolase [Candidatus Cloacimonadota bacterium]
MIKNIIFDLGNVLINHDFNRFFAVCGYKPDERDLDEALPVLMKFDAGQIGREEFYTGMQEVFGFDLSRNEFEAAWCDNFCENTEMIDFARELSSGYSVFILSNTDEIHLPYIWKTFPTIHFFNEKLMLSYELGAVKPGKLIYEKALEKFDLNAKECLFIDDKFTNVKSAETCDITSIWHQTNSETFEKIAKILTLKT